MTPEQNIAIAKWIGMSVGSLGFLNAFSKKELFQLWYKGRPFGRKDTAANQDEAFEKLAPNFANRADAFVELLRVCAARCIYISLEWLPRGVWRCILELKDNPESVHSEGPTECEALALAVLKLIESETTK